MYKNLEVFFANSNLHMEDTWQIFGITVERKQNSPKYC